MSLSLSLDLYDGIPENYSPRKYFKNIFTISKRQFHRLINRRKKTLLQNNNNNKCLSVCK